MPKRKLPSLQWVKYVHSKGKVYAYFNTGKKNSRGKTIYAPMPHPSAAGFFDSYAALKGGRTKRATARYTIAELIDDYEASGVFSDLSVGTQKAYRANLKRVNKELGEFVVDDLKRSDVQVVIDNTVMGAASHNGFLAVLGVIYTFARKRGKTNLEPTKDFAKRKTGEYESWPEHILEAGLIAKKARTRLAITLLYYTGQRIGDVCKMRWTDIRDDAVYVVQQKTSKKLRIPLMAALRAELDRTPKTGLTILTNYRGGPLSPQRPRKELKEFTAEFGRPDLVPHGLRKNAVISLLEAGCTIAEVASITGQTYKVVEHYARQVDQARLGDAAIFKFENKRGRGNDLENSAKNTSNSSGGK
ncbi:tyrosine-type recombinase/integrase [Novosphingopyxis sp. YJ-S2-01]|uniref:tyrosine-type recombinase/integrase n=1 Tax=Novosphingopyxis sp. YJ-S2-01 TaxID=2794021 RepID=UPI0018DBB22C|nr:tyrosine-type recombinase/integrase [Novosphingopyxis sp. YJ-S2-01]MBH9537483.1 tyrosine-type recombinase/integrase [Novosphingopyxis sp. YJ-S2-01]